MAWTSVGPLLLLLGVSPAAGRAAAAPPAQATASAEACKAAWPAEKPETVEMGGRTIELLRAEFTRASESVLCMRGVFWRDTPRRIRGIADPAAVKSLVVTSDGGWIEPAIDLAELAERHRWLVVVKDKCLSSCANYVFLARTEKVVLPRSLLGWHGLPKDPDDFDLGEFEKEKARLIPASEWADIDAATLLAIWTRSKAFLAERGIPPALCRARPQAGHSKDYVARLQALGLSGANPFWSYGRRALETRYNVHGILSMWEPRTPEEGTDLAQRRFGTNLFYFDLTEP